jgi:hypothetical protein|tara:strand:- start:90 stop:1625 length:1536 start_codon:yes stop_codon:yes gene_type:complete
MAQHDMNIANQGFPATRADLNNALQALATNNSGTSAPSTTFANQWWYDETNNKLYIRNEANNAWIQVAVLDQTNNEWQITTGVIQAKDSDGLALKTDDGTTRLFIQDSDGKIGIGTSSPSHELVVFGTGAGNATVQIEGEGGADPQINFLTNNATHWSVGVDDSRFDTFKINNHSAVGETNEYLCVDTSGKVGINTDAMSNNLSIEGSSYTLMGMKRTTGVTTGTGEFAMHVETNSQVSISYDDQGSIVFGTAGTPTTAAGFSEKVRIDDGGAVFIGTTNSSVATSNSDYGAVITNGGRIFSTTNAAHHDLNRASGDGELIRIRRGGNQVGSISVTSSATTYNTSSDYRLKENLSDISDGITRVKQLSPKRFNFIAEPDTTVDGFLAHEAQTVVPEAVTGTHDGMMDEEYIVSAPTGDIYTPSSDATYDEDGNEVSAATDEVIHSSDVEEPSTLEEGQRWRRTTKAVMGTRSVPEYQGIDQAKLVPLLTAALQEAISKIEALETRVAALEG